MGGITRRRTVAALAGLFLFVNCNLALAAKSPSIAGHALDGTGQPISGVSVTVLPEAGGVVRHATSGADGAYQFESVPDGTYRVDFNIQGFDSIRRNHVRVRPDGTATVDATLLVSAICDCVTVIDAAELRERSGRVVDESGRPLPHARLEITSPLRREVGYADSQGRFRVRVPVSETWPITASDSGFGTVTLQASAIGNGPIVLRLPFVGTAHLAETERFKGPCCPGDLFTHDGR
jgi:hypothetical protein